MDPENVLKGRMAESLVEELLKQCGNKVYRFGYEAVLQNLTQLEESFERESEMGQRITSIPDFIVVSKKKISLVEVKFRTDLTLLEKDVKKLKIVEEFWQAKIIWVTLNKPYFRVSSPPYFNEKGKLRWRPLENDSLFGVSSKTLKSFNQLIESYYAKTTD